MCVEYACELAAEEVGGYADFTVDLWAVCESKFLFSSQVFFFLFWALGNP